MYVFEKDGGNEREMGIAHRNFKFAWYVTFKWNINLNFKSLDLCLALLIK